MSTTYIYLKKQAKLYLYHQMSCVTLLSKLLSTFYCCRHLVLMYDIRVGFQPASFQPANFGKFSIRSTNFLYYFNLHNFLVK